MENYQIFSGSGFALSAEDVYDWIGWLSLFSPRARDRVIQSLIVQTYEPRAIIARAGEPATTWIGVSEGLVKVSAVTSRGHAIMFTAVADGSWVGEGSVIKNDLRRYSLTALRQCSVVHVPRSTFMWMLQESNEFSRFIIDHLNERTGQFIAMMEIARTTDPVARVAGAIANLFNPVLNPKAASLFKITQEELGELAGLSRSSTNQAVRALSRLKLISTQYGGILVVDLKGLHELFANEDS